MREKREKYVPNYGDLERFRSERLIRTKSRTYQIACWQGYLGSHEFFLGNRAKGGATLTLTMVAAGSAFYEWWLGLILILSAIGLNVIAVRRIAATDPASNIYGEKCGPLFHSFHIVGSLSLMWDVNFWRDQIPTDPPPPDMN